MIRLGTFTRTTNGFFGQITTFQMEDDLSILPIEDPATENTPDYRVLRGLENDAIQVGCAWARQGERIGLWLAVMRAESQGDASAVSPKGAMGLMQIMPDTWRELRATLNLGADPYDPHDNIVAGAAYLRRLHDRYGDMGFLAAYNAGPGRYEELLRGSRALPDETRKYVTRVTRLLRGESIGDPVFDVDFAVRTPRETPSGSPLFVGPFASQTVVQNAPEVMPVSDHVMRFVAPPHGLFVSVSQRSAP